MDMITLSMAKKYSDSLKSGISAAKAEEGKLLLTLDNGQTVEVELPKGISIVNLKIENNHLKCELSNGEEIDAGELPSGSGFDLYINGDKIEIEEGKIDLSLPYINQKTNLLGNFKVKTREDLGGIVTLEKSFFDLFDNFEANFPNYSILTEEGMEGVVVALVDCTLYLTDSNGQNIILNIENKGTINEFLRGTTEGAIVGLVPGDPENPESRRIMLRYESDGIMHEVNWDDQNGDNTLLDLSPTLDIYSISGKITPLDKRLLPIEAQKKLVTFNCNETNTVMFQYSDSTEASEEVRDSFAANHGSITGNNATAFNEGSASGDSSFAVNKSEASGQASFSAGQYNNSYGQSSATFGEYTNATGKKAFTAGHGTTATGDNAAAFGERTTASNKNSFSIGRYNVATKISETDGTAFCVGNGNSTIPKNAFSVLFDGTVSASGTLTAANVADYAENFEWFDYNIKKEDRIGYFVTLEGDKIRLAQSEDNYILGVTSGSPFVLGNGDCDSWNGMYLRDDFNRIIMEPAPKTIEKVDEETGEIIIEEVEGEFEGVRPKINPDYNSELEYIPRRDRAEWCPVGMLGILPVRQDGSLKVNRYAKVANGGIATAAEEGYRVIEITNENVAKIIFR